MNPSTTSLLKGSLDSKDGNSKDGMISIAMTLEGNGIGMPNSLTCPQKGDSKPSKTNKTGSS